MHMLQNFTLEMAPALTTASSLAADLDCLSSLAAVAVENNYVRPMSEPQILAFLCNQYLW